MSWNLPLEINNLTYEVKKDTQNILPSTGPGHTYFDGSVSATSFIKVNGTSTEYLMADGSTTSGGGSIPQPWPGNFEVVTNLICQDVETQDYFSVNDELKRIDNITSATQAPDVTNINGLIVVPAIAVDRIFDTSQSVWIDMGQNNVEVNATALKFNGDDVLTTPFGAQLEATSFKKTGGTNIQYLMGDGSTLTQSATSGNSNFYLYI